MDVHSRWIIFKAIEAIHPEKLVDKNFVKRTLQEAVKCDRPEHLKVIIDKKEMNEYITMLMNEFCT